MTVIICNYFRNAYVRIKVMKIAKKNLIAIGGLGFILSGAIVATIAYSHDRSIMNNDFTLDQYQTEFSETFAAPTNWKTCEKVDKTFVVKNNYSEPISVRIKTSSSWKDSNNVSMSNYSSGSRVNMALINYDNTNEWITKKYDNTTYVEYYRDLQPGETTSSFISGVTLNCDANLDVDTGYNDATYKLKITAQTVQASAKSEAWRTTATLSSLKTNFDYSVSPSSITDGDTCASTNSNSRYDILSCVKRVQHADALAADYDSNFGAQFGYGDYPVYGWFSSDYRTFYWYSQADDVYLPNDSSSFFSGMGRLESADGLADIKTSRVTDMKYMFNYDHDLTDISGLASWDVSKVTDMSYMFFHTYLDSLEPLRNWDVSKVTNMFDMFYQDRQNSKIETAEPISGWNVSRVTRMGGMFGHIRDFDASSLDNWTLNSSVDIDSQTFQCNVVKPSWYTYTPPQCSD